MLEFFFFSSAKHEQEKKNFPQEKIERKFILGKNHHTQGWASLWDSVTAGRMEMSVERPTEHARTSLPFSARFEKSEEKRVFGKNGCSCPFYRPEIFSL